MTWSPDDLERLGSAAEIQISSTRPDGSLRPFVTIWGVRVDDAYREKYSAYSSIVDGITGPQMHDLTLRLDAR